ncbi:MAG TPA: GIY-YIG nuclease family protein [Candidatus Dormibacteraeota bacterium]|jgi:hypothetical protein|nr:GIY-YIG nuclease family protein [Candidatus Dormibacteraeota bacterium]
MSEDSGQRLYVIAASPEGPCKIGIAKDAEARRRDLQTGHPEALSLHFTAQCPAAAHQERQMHKYLAPKRLNGEWFAVSVTEAADALADLEEWGEDVLAPDVIRGPKTYEAFIEAVKKRCPDFTEDQLVEVVSVVMLLGVSRATYRTLRSEWEQRMQSEAEAVYGDCHESA